MTVIGVSTLPQERSVITVLDKIKAFFKRPKPGRKRNPVIESEPREVSNPQEEGDESSSQ